MTSILDLLSDWLYFLLPFDDRDREGSSGDPNGGGSGG